MLRTGATQEGNNDTGRDGHRCAHHHCPDQWQRRRDDANRQHRRKPVQLDTQECGDLCQERHRDQPREGQREEREFVWTRRYRRMATQSTQLTVSSSTPDHCNWPWGGDYRVQVANRRSRVHDGLSTQCPAFSHMAAPRLLRLRHLRLGHRSPTFPCAFSLIIYARRAGPPLPEVMLRARRLIAKP